MHRHYTLLDHCNFLIVAVNACICSSISTVATRPSPSTPPILLDLDLDTVRACAFPHCLLFHTYLPFILNRITGKWRGMLGICCIEIGLNKTTTPTPIDIQQRFRLSLACWCWIEFKAYVYKCQRNWNCNRDCRWLKFLSHTGYRNCGLFK